jgi:hypothetical protein
MSERILMKFIVGQRVIKQGEDSRFEGQVVACFVKRDFTTTAYCTSPASGNCASRCLKLPARLKPSHSRKNAGSRHSSSIISRSYSLNQTTPPMPKPTPTTITTRRMTNPRVSISNPFRHAPPKAKTTESGMFTRKMPRGGSSRRRPGIEQLGLRLTRPVEPAEVQSE